MKHSNRVVLCEPNFVNVVSVKPAVTLPILAKPVSLSQVPYTCEVKEYPCLSHTARLLLDLIPSFESH